jgi:Fur family ferric uptake transcriptional regulator
VTKKPEPHHHEATGQAMLKSAGLRVTAVRLKAIEVMRGSRSAVDAGELAQRVGEALGKAADRVTIYRTLCALVDAGVAHRIDAGDRTFRYSLTDHAHCSETQHRHDHPHMVCDTCGTVECIEDAEVIIRPRAATSGGGTPSRTKFRITQQSVTLHGTCDRCDGGRR